MVSGKTAFQELAEKVSRICSEYRHMRKRCVELERKIEKLSKFADSTGSGGRKRGAAESNRRAGLDLDREALRAKVEEILSELADIG